MRVHMLPYTDYYSGNILSTVINLSLINFNWLLIDYLKFEIHITTIIMHEGFVILLRKLFQFLFFKHLRLHTGSSYKHHT